MPALGRRPSTPQVELFSGARDGQSAEGAPARPLQHLTAKRGVQAGDRRRRDNARDTFCLS